jgi:uncharacterized membrane protein YccC
MNLTAEQTGQVDLRHSVITAASCLLAAILVFWLHCDNPWWAVISAWVISSSDFQASLTKSLLRVAGTLAGYWVGLISISFTEDGPFLRAVAMFVIGVTGTYMRYRSRFSYAWIIGSVTALLLMCIEIANPGSAYEMGRYRLYEIISGVIAASLCQRLVGPLLGFEFGTHKAEPKAEKPSTIFADDVQLRTIALVGGLLPLITLLVWSRFDLPSLSQIILTTFVTLDRDVATARVRFTQRILGCLIGGGIGLMVVDLAVSSLFIWSIILFGGIFVFSRLHLSKSPWAYVGTQGGVAFILTMVTGNDPPDTIVPVVGRMAGMISGVVIIAGLCVILRLWQERLNPV